MEFGSLNLKVRKKTWTSHKPYSSFSVLKEDSSSSRTNHYQPYSICEGKLVGNSVQVTKTHHIIALYKNGCFGNGNLSSRGIEKTLANENLTNSQNDSDVPVKRRMCLRALDKKQLYNEHLKLATKSSGKLPLDDLGHSDFNINNVMETQSSCLEVTGKGKESCNEFTSSHSIMFDSCDKALNESDCNSQFASSLQCNKFEQNVTFDNFETDSNDNRTSWDIPAKESESYWQEALLNNSEMTNDERCRKCRTVVDSSDMNFCSSAVKPSSDVSPHIFDAESSAIGKDLNMSNSNIKMIQYDSLPPPLGYSAAHSNPDLSKNSDNSVHDNDKSCDICIIDESDNDLREVCTILNHRSSKARLKEDPHLLREHLILSLEEAFFLSYGLGYLVVTDNDKPMDLLTTWDKFCSIQSNFIARYIVYHRFRAKGWVPKSGIKYGADFVLYKEGPAAYHSTFLVLVIPKFTTDCRESSKDPSSSTGVHSDTSCEQSLDWINLSGLNRIAEQVAKDLLLCYVTRSRPLSAEELSSPECIRQHRVSEIIVRRWVSQRERETVDLLNVS